MNIDPLPPAASTISHRIDALFFVMLGVTGAVAIVITILIITFAVRYRAGSTASRDQSPVTKTALEITWVVAPLIIFLLVFGWSSRLYAALHSGPRDALSIYVLGKQWMWKVEHPNGKREIDQLHVPVGKPVQLLMTSQDVIHSFYVPSFRIKQDVLPGRYTRLWFTATQLGRFDLFCAEYCGSNHAHMLGGVIVMNQADYARWLDSATTEPTLTQEGFDLFRERGCSGCHDERSSVHAPSLQNLFGRTVHLSDGRAVIADENYLRDSILTPSKDVVSGYQDIMPSFKAQVTEEQITALIEYIKTRGAAHP